MMFFILFLSVLSIIYGINENQQIINITINEELPLSTILFITTNNITYRLFDSGRNQNSFIHYNTLNGHISLSQSLDREYLCSEHICSCTKCQLTIELIEWQIPYRLLKLILNVDDINDNIPKFSSDNYKLNIIENAPIGFELPIESAYDTDFGENSRIHYELKNQSNGPFELVTKINGGLTLKVIEEIDREKQDSYQFQLIAFDQGKPRQQSSTNLFIQDMNDNSVLLSETYIQLHVSENAPVGTELIFVNATDKDIGLNGKIHYSISNGFPSSSWRDYFRIGDSNGIITLINPLDYESEQSYRLTIQVRDRGENSLACFVTIDISIVDENDNSPQAFITFVNPLKNNSIISIIENTPIGDILAHISISDRDSGLNGELSYRIEQGEDLIGIKILDEKSFLLIVNCWIDREDENLKFNKFILIISDHGKPSKSIRLEYQINIIDLNDSPPKFNSLINCNLDLNLLKNRSLDQPLFQVEAIDFDLEDNGLISYSIISPLNHSFLINDRGEVFYLNHFNESSYHLKIMAIDHGKAIRLNSTFTCHLFTSNDNDFENLNKSQSLIDSKVIFQYNYFYLFIIFLTFIFLLMIFCFYKFIFNHQQCLNRNKTYHLYVSIPRKSSYNNNNESVSSSQISDNQSEDYERLVQIHNEQGFDKISLLNHHQFCPIVRNNSSSLISSVSISTKSPHELMPELKQDSRPVSLSISTATTYTSTGADVSLKFNNTNSTFVRLAEEENIDV
ncbi:unnamed protein product [Rotaria socialis]|uniref:Cadherin domain-containing protein n=1 Tax=Rotaria socialis TaxID=392032 RepID=A0A820WA55_9BILA|nr:unnamed protein product [Rotaria socialis]CAF4512559.1 unnamed protein product [Rotaria socialis]CAF4814856.1 unnamed protein product [Rotaria socialis]